MTTVGAQMAEAPDVQKLSCRKTCDFVDATGNQCRRSPRSLHAQHWVQHILEELKWLTDERLEPSKAKLLTSPEKIALAQQFLFECPFKCRRNGRVCTYTVRTNLTRHMRNACMANEPAKKVREVARRATATTPSYWENLEKIVGYRGYR